MSHPDREQQVSSAFVALADTLVDDYDIIICLGEVVTEQLQTALNSRVIIEQAKGVVAQRLGVDMDVAFDRLRRYARNRNLRLAEVARQAVDGELDPAVLAVDQPTSGVGPTGPAHPDRSQRGH